MSNNYTEIVELIIIIVGGYIMNSSVIVGLFALIGTIFGSLMGTLSMSKMLSYRIDLLESKMDKLSNLLERMTLVEHKIKDIDNYVKDNCE